jgi:hypothetical protein
MIMQAGLPRSVVIQRRPSFSATAAVVPEPPGLAVERRVDVDQIHLAAQAGCVFVAGQSAIASRLSP